MPLHPQTRAFVESFEAQPAVDFSSIDAATFRAASAMPASATPGDPVARIEDRWIDGPGGPLRLRLYVPASVGAWPVTLYFFGGGFVIGKPEQVDHICRALARRADTLGWRSTFLAAAGVGALALAAGLPRMRESRDPGAVGLDWPGSLSFTLALATFTFGIMQAPEHGWISGRVLGLLAGAVAWMLLFVWIEGRVRRPMLDLSLFRYARFVGVQVLPLATCYCYVVLLIMLPIRFIGIEGHSELDAGLMLMALSLPMLVIPALAAALAHRISAGLLSSMGLLLAAAGLLWLSHIAPGQSAWAWVSPMLVVGIGAGLPWGLMDGLSVSVVPPERAGMATGIFSTTRVAGECIALALVGAVLVLLLQARLQALLPGLDAGSLSVAAQRLATGNLAQARALLPQIGQAQLMGAYDEAFRQLVYLLATITVVSAVVVSLFLGRPQAILAQADPSPCS